jgi:amidase
MNKYFIFSFLVVSQISFGQTFKKINFSPSNFYSAFSPSVKPVMTIRPGDTVYTESIDCNGVDKNGKKQTVGDVANPLTGPFYVEGASEGDVLAVSFLSISFNRNYATCIEYFNERCLPASITKHFGNQFNPVEWNIDIEKKLHPPKENMNT